MGRTVTAERRDEAKERSFRDLFRWIAEFVEASERGIAPTAAEMAAIRADHESGVSPTDAAFRHAERRGS